MTRHRRGSGGVVLERERAAPVEDRSYLFYAAAALIFALGAGLALGLAAAFAPALGWRLSEARLVQAHGTSELEGWLGLFVAGMGLRLVPRLGHQPPFPRVVTMPVLVLMVVGAGLQLAAGLGIGVAGVALAGAASEAAGLVLFAFAIGFSLWRRRAGGRAGAEPWRLLIWPAAAWWVAWAVLTVAVEVAGGRSGVAQLETASVWVVLLGAIGNLIWAVQARSVAVFYGRRPPSRRALAGPTLLLNLGTLAAVVSFVAPTSQLAQVGLGLAGLGLIWMAPVAGSLGGQALRLREPSRPAAAFIVMANRWALTAGGCLVLSALLYPALGTAGADRFDMAAIHALGLGLATTLIVGMARILAPVFAIARAVPGSTRRSLRVIWFLLGAATACRVGAALLEGAIPAGAVATLFALAGLFTLAGLGLFAAGFASAWAKQGARRRQLRASIARIPAARRYI